MKVLIAIHTLELGGSQINAIELAERVAAVEGYTVEILAPDGVLAQRITAAGIRLHLAPASQHVPSLRYIRKLDRIARQRKYDLIHCYEWDTTINAMFGPGWLHGTPVISTIYSMDVPYLVPRSIPIIVGTRNIQRSECALRAQVELIEPPVDVALNAPGATGSTVRSKWGIGDGDVLLVVVCRLAARLKLEGLLSAIKAVNVLDVSRPIRFLIVGDGPARDEVSQLAESVNREHGREVVTLVGERVDPREFYEAADVAIGMGASALKSMAFAKPVLVQGEGGFWRTLTPQSLDFFMEHGFYGVGDGEDGIAACVVELSYLLGLTETERHALGDFGRSIVEQHFNLDLATAALLPLYISTASQRTVGYIRIFELAGEIMTLLKHHLAIWLQRNQRSAAAR